MRVACLLCCALVLGLAGGLSSRKSPQCLANRREESHLVLDKQMCPKLVGHGNHGKHALLRDMLRCLDAYEHEPFVAITSSPVRGVDLCTTRTECLMAEIVEDGPSLLTCSEGNRANHEPASAIQ